ncbi:MAG: DUF1566 domain-containing protein [Bacteroidales bacterium]|nr:DUF1566 domain-containing protein [Bacteroidales bacterium]MCF8457078.1 DUF1566 domain-containing protein [Bacteroidales bacterium]
MKTNFDMTRKRMSRNAGAFLILLTFLLQMNSAFAQATYPVVDTGQEIFYDSVTTIAPPAMGATFYGQDATYAGHQPSYTNNGDGTVTDNVTGLMWVQTPDLDNDGDIDYDDKMSYDEAMLAADTFSLAGCTDWRLPSIKEMYSLILFSGEDPSGYSGTSTAGLTPFIDTNYFGFGYGDQNAGERIIDAQLASSTLYVSTTMGGNETMFGVNFADGRIKGYPTGPMPGQTVDKQFYVMFVRGNTSYGINSFEDNNDSTITDSATDLMWTKYDNGQGLYWDDALAYAENATVAGHSDWRLPNVKELQSIVDYTRSPATTSSAAIDPVFHCSTIIDQGGNTDYPFYWSGTTHANMSPNNSGAWASYVCFGEAEGWMEMPPMSGNYTLMDVHGAGAQRSDPKTGSPSDYPYGHGPQGDVVYVFNYVRLVRDASVVSSTELNSTEGELKIYPNPATDNIAVDFNDLGSGKASLEIYNMLGAVIYSENVSAKANTVINISKLRPGVYFLKFQNERSAYTKKIIKD